MPIYLNDNELDQIAGGENPGYALFYYLCSSLRSAYLNGGGTGMSQTQSECFNSCG